MTKTEAEALALECLRGEAERVKQRGNPVLMSRLTLYAWSYMASAIANASTFDMSEIKTLTAAFQAAMEIVLRENR